MVLLSIYWFLTFKTIFHQKIRKITDTTCLPLSNLFSKCDVGMYCTMESSIQIHDKETLHLLFLKLGGLLFQFSILKEFSTFSKLHSYNKSGICSERIYR